MLTLTDDLIIIPNDDRIAFERCCAKLRLVDRELAHIGHVHIRTYKHESDILYECHDSHSYSAFEHILAAIQDAEAFARSIRNHRLRVELLEDAMIRRLSFYDLYD